MHQSHRRAKSRRRKRRRHAQEHRSDDHPAVEAQRQSAAGAAGRFFLIAGSSQGVGHCGAKIELFSKQGVSPMPRKFLAALFIVAPLLWAAELSAQTAESKLAALEKLPAQERQQRLYEAGEERRRSGDLRQHGRVGDETAHRRIHEALSRRESSERAFFRRRDHHSARIGSARRQAGLRRGFERATGRVGADRKENRHALSLSRKRIFPRRLQGQRRFVDGLHDQCHGQRLQHAPG